MIDFVLNNLEFLWLVGAAIFGIIIDYIKLRFGIGGLKKSIDDATKANEKLTLRADAQEDLLQKLSVGFAAFDGTIQAEINKLLIEFNRSKK